MKNKKEEVMSILKDLLILTLIDTHHIKSMKMLMFIILSINMLSVELPEDDKFDYRSHYFKYSLSI